MSRVQQRRTAWIVWAALGGGTLLLIAVAHVLDGLHVRELPSLSAVTSEPVETATLSLVLMIIATIGFVFGMVWPHLVVDREPNPDSQNVLALRAMLASASGSAELAAAQLQLRRRFMRRSVTGWALGKVSGIAVGIGVLLTGQGFAWLVFTALFLVQWCASAPWARRQRAFISRHLAAAGVPADGAVAVASLPLEA